MTSVPKIVEKITKAKSGINNSMMTFIRNKYLIKNLISIIYVRQSQKNINEKLRLNKKNSANPSKREVNMGGR
jgi:hypothetical protein